MTDVLTKGLELTEKRGNYNRWIFNTIEPYLGKRILEIGSGFGTLTEMFQNKDLVIATDINESFITRLQKKFKKRKNIMFAKIDVQKISEVKTVRNKNLDTIIGINVLEHIKDDVVALKHLSLLLNPGGKIILFVPAFPLLFGDWDKMIGHFRRYTKIKLEQKLKASGFIPIESFYFNSLGFLGWGLNKLLRKTPQNDVVKLQAQIFDKYLVPPLSKLENIFRPPIGQSLFMFGLKHGKIL